MLTIDIEQAKLNKLLFEEQFFYVSTYIFILLN